MQKLILRLNLCVLMCLLATCIAGAQETGTFNETITSGSDTLTYTVVVAAAQTCYQSGKGILPYYTSSYSNFSIAQSGTTTPLTGAVEAIWDKNPPAPGCPETSEPTTTLTNSNGTQVVFTPAAYTGGTFTATIQPSGIQGLVYVKYVVVGVTYAPPGILSDVQYMGTTSVGTTATYSSSFSQGYSIGVTTTWGLGIPAGSTSPTDGKVQITIGETNTITQSQNSSTTNTTNKSTSVSYQTEGYPTTYSPIGTPPPSLPHDYDTIQIWLNPELVFTATPPSGDNPATIQWNGYAYDPYDQAGPDVASIQVGCLNGDFLASYCATQQGVLNRAWVTTEPVAQMSPVTNAQVTAYGCAPQTAESPSICPNTQDAYNILAADPLAYNPGGTTYTLFDSQPLPITTADGRYTQISGTNDPNPVQYVPDEKETYNVTQMNTQMQSNGGSSKYEEKITISVAVSSGFLNIFNEKTTYTNTDDFTQMSSWLNTLTTQQTIADAFSIQSSAPPNYVSGEFIAYQDNQFGTFLLVPSN